MKHTAQIQLQYNYCCGYSNVLLAIVANSVKKPQLTFDANFKITLLGNGNLYSIVEM